MIKQSNFAARMSQFVSRLRHDQSGLAMTEFAFSLPILMGLGMYGTETAFLATTNMKVSQTALSLADNASRLDQVDNGVLTPTVKESDVNQVLLGAKLQADTIELTKHGRIILSSLEVTAGGQQFIRWRRCLGKRNDLTNYIDDADNNGVIDPSFTGMGPTGAKAQASSGSAVMYVEVDYQYQPLFKNLFGAAKILHQEAAFTIRGNRNLNANPPLTQDVGSNQKTCTKYTET